MTAEGSWFLVVARSGLFLSTPVSLLATAVTPGRWKRGYPKDRDEGASPGTSFLLFQVRTLFVSGLPLDIKPRELYLLFRPFKVPNWGWGVWKHRAALGPCPIPTDTGGICERPLVSQIIGSFYSPKQLTAPGKTPTNGIGCPDCAGVLTAP